MTALPFMHVGLLVHDLEEAVERYTDVLGAAFTDSATVHVDHMDDGGRVEPHDIRVVYSTGGPPYFEFIEMQETGIYGHEHGEGLHHVGMWEPDCEKRLSALRAKGLEPEAVQYTSTNRIIVAYFSPRNLNGMRLEIVDESRRPMMENWIAGGKFID
jgi:catechol 2,3-dioxygenase-like lactoylglutathione lyase family enzyme